MNNLLYNQFYSAGSSAQKSPAFSGPLEPLHSGTKFPVKFTVSMDNEGWTEREGYMRAGLQITFAGLQRLRREGIYKTAIHLPSKGMFSKVFK